VEPAVVVTALLAVLELAALQIRAVGAVVEVKVVVAVTAARV
jgi:hypothetical protein